MLSFCFLFFVIFPAADNNKSKNKNSKAKFNTWLQSSRGAEEPVSQMTRGAWGPLSSDSLALWLLWASGALAQPALDAAVERARAAADSAARGLPGLSVAVSVRGETVWSEGYGFADLEHRVPVTPQTRFRIASVSKPMTAASATLPASCDGTTFVYRSPYW